MVIVLKDADFSAKNIGTIDIVELTPAASAAFTASGRESITGPQKAAMNDFFALTETAIWPKLTKVYLPMIGEDLSFAFVNYCDQNFATDVTPNGAYFEIRNHGLAPKNHTAVAAANGITLGDFAWDMKNTCVLAFQTESVVMGERNFAVMSKNSMTSQYLAFSTASSVSSNPSVTGICRGSTVNNKTTDAGITATGPAMRGFSCDGTNCHILLNDNAVEESTVGTFTAITAGIPFYPYTSLTAGAVDADAKAMGMLIIGSYLTAEEMLQIQGVANELFTAFNV